MTNDALLVLQWWAVLFGIGIIFLPTTSLFFSKFGDFGYIFSKTLGIIVISYTIYLLSFLHVVPFSTTSIFLVLWLYFLINVIVLKKQNLKKLLFQKKKIFLVQEFIFLSAILIWSYVRAFQPDINGLEKFMDFGFVNSILRSSYSPPIDMWFPPEPINYYYFGHFFTAVLTKISFLPSYITYNLMIATLFAFCFLESFIIGFHIFQSKSKFRKILAGTLGSLLVTLGGNLHTLYAFFKPYENEHPKPFWDLVFSPFTLTQNSYWYPNATRFIPNTIHEFPLYSFVVSDLHGHVLGIPIVLMIVGLLLHEFLNGKIQKKSLLLIAWLLAVCYMTNAWDLLIYGLLTTLVITAIEFKNIELTLQKNTGIFSFNKYSLKGSSVFLRNLLLKIGVLGLVIYLSSYTFNSAFSPFASQIGILCAPDFLVKIGSYGPLLFEKDHCQHSIWWQLITLYGLFYFFVLSFFVFIITRKKYIPSRSDVFVTVLILVSTVLIALPEFVYAKDIYPAHYRANTMFKLTYQAFMILSICSGYIIVHISKQTKNKFFSGIAVLLVSTVLIYPFFAIPSYYNNFSKYKGLDGTVYLKTSRPSDYSAIQWINTNITGQPVILEAQGDSYTDYERISSNTGLPTVLGWTVHEWLWRGSYDIASPRIEDVKKIYESGSLSTTKTLLKKYNVSYVYIGNLEYEKYPSLDIKKFENLGETVFEEGTTRLIRLAK